MIAVYVMYYILIMIVLVTDYYSVWAVTLRTDQ